MFSTSQNHFNSPEVDNNKTNISNNIAGNYNNEISFDLLAQSQNNNNENNIINNQYIEQNYQFDSLVNHLIDRISMNIPMHKIIDCINGRYEGDWKNGRAEGKGVYYYNDGGKYEGEFKNDKKEGQGIYYYKNGDKYQGSWKNDQMEGKGVYYYSNERYEGDWKNNRCEGKGVYYFSNGDSQIGSYKNGKPIGIHARLCSNGEVIKINY